MGTSNLTYLGNLTVTTCWCGTRHAVPAELYDYQLRQHNDGERQTGIYCPLGHTHIFSGKGEAEIQREKAARLTAQLDQARARADALERSRSAVKGQLTKARKRAEIGVCPCCHRSFVQLARHMKTKHPNFDAAPDV